MTLTLTLTLTLTPTLIQTQATVHSSKVTQLGRPR